jgi:thiopurine S-methyltransferase
LLIEHWSKLGVDQGQVFVPLCGKSQDMVWLCERGHAVLGVELSPVAVNDFFTEQTISFSTQNRDGFQIFSGDGIQIFCGDFFDLKPEHLAQTRAIFDRAALVALPPHLQIRYAQHLLAILPQRPPILLMVFEYDQHEMAGPPFSITEQRVRELFGAAYKIEILAEKDALAEQPGLQQRGLSQLQEKVYRLSALA